MSAFTRSLRVIEGRHSDPFRYLGRHVENDAGGAGVHADAAR